MEQNKTAELIKALRLEKGYTQKQLADLLNVSDKTISKWERGNGLPDISILSGLAEALSVSVDSLLCGAAATNSKIEGSMKNTKIYYCEKCGNIITSTSAAEISCCGRKSAPLDAQKADRTHEINVELSDDERYITCAHSMEKEHYISFVAFLQGEKITLIKQYPEWNLSVRLPNKVHGRLLWFCTKHGLFYKYI